MITMILKPSSSHFVGGVILGGARSEIWALSQALISGNTPDESSQTRGTKIRHALENCVGLSSGILALQSHQFRSDSVSNNSNMGV